jgi:hypothetical protein
MRIESAFIADHAEVNPATRTLDVRSGFQSSIKVPKLPFRHVLALALVIQVASDEYGRVFTLGIEVDRVDELPVMLHQDFSFEIPRGIYAADGVSHHYPFTFSLPVDFYDVGLHSVIVGDEDSDVAHVPFIYEWSPWTNTDRWSVPRAMGHPLPPSPRCCGSSAFGYPMARDRGTKHGFGE